jgi:hypothetical protein
MRDKTIAMDGDLPVTSFEILLLVTERIVHRTENLNSSPHRLHWSHWRRRQYRAQACQYQRQAARDQTI